MSLIVKVSANNNILPRRINRRKIIPFNQKQKPSFAIIPRASMSSASDISIMVNSCCTGKMGKAVIKAADSAGLNFVPVFFGSEEDSRKTVQACGKDITVHGPSERESTLASLFDKHPNLIVMDYTVPTAVNENAELYCKVGLPFVMGTTGGDRNRLYKTVEESKVYAVISPQIGHGVSSSKQIRQVWNCQGCHFLLPEIGGLL